jgi:hypothetical protein
MPPRRRAPTPTPIDVDAERRKLADGKIDRVGISRSAQFPDGGIGRVRRVGDPTVDGEEYIQVELSLNGTKDTLPFTPADLTPATRATAPAAPPEAGPRSTRGRTKAAPAPGTREPQPRRPESGSALPETNSLFGDSSFTATTPSPSAPSRPTSSAPTASAPRSSPTTTTPENAVTSSAAPPPATAHLPAPAAPSAVKPKTTRGGAKRTPTVAITIATTDTEPPQWRIEAKVGARVVLRSGSVGPARVWELVRMLDDETLIRAVGSVLDDQRKAAQARADALATELAEVRAELEALPDARA